MRSLILTARARICAVLVTLAVLSSLFLTRNIDFRVYWVGVGALIAHERPLYGPASGLGFPMHYRYPPITYLLLWPLSRVPMHCAGFLWMMGAWGAATAAVILTARRAGLQITSKAAIMACGYILAYAVLAVRSGNVQPYIIAMILSALMLSESRRLVAAILLGLAITFKIWPIFFLPWFLRRGRRIILVWLLPVLLVLWSIPFCVWSPTRYREILGQWFRSEVQSATADSEIWYFPGQSLRAVLLRYLTTSRPWLKGFPDIHIMSLSPKAAVHLWEIAAVIIYVAVCFAMYRSDPSARLVWDGLAFALFTLLEPYCLKSSMISMGPAVLIAAGLYSIECNDSRKLLARRLFAGACMLSFTAAIAQYKPLLRLLLAIGVDFYAALLLFFALLLWIIPDPSAPESRANGTYAPVTHGY